MPYDFKKFTMWEESLLAFDKCHCPGQNSNKRQIKEEERKIDRWLMETLDGEIGQRLMHQWQGFEPQKKSSKACALQNCFVLVRHEDSIYC